MRGIVWEMEMGRWREKKLDKPRARLPWLAYAAPKRVSLKINIPSCDMWCVLGTLGSFLNEASFPDASLFLRLLLSPEALPSARAVEEAGTDWPAPVEMSLEPLSDFEGFDEEKRRW